MKLVDLQEEIARLVRTPRALRQRSPHYLTPEQVGRLTEFSRQMLLAAPADENTYLQQPTKWVPFQ